MDFKYLIINRYVCTVFVIGIIAGVMIDRVVIGLFSA